MFFRPRGSSNILTESIRLEWSFLWLNLPKGRPCLTLARSGASLCFTLVSSFSAYPLLGVKNAAFPGFVSSYSWACFSCRGHRRRVTIVTSERFQMISVEITSSHHRVRQKRVLPQFSSRLPSFVLALQV